MIIGKPNDYTCEPHRWFAWRPVLLWNGQIAWLEVVCRVWGRKVIYDLAGVPKVTKGWVYCTIGSAEAPPTSRE